MKTTTSTFSSNVISVGAFEGRIRKSINDSISAKERLRDDPDLISRIGKVAELLVSAFKSGSKAILFGNGGSAADAQHIAAEFVGRFAFDRPALPALALSVNTSCITAIANDYGFDLVFSRQIEALAKRGDLAIGITTSGNSPNVIRALETAAQMGLFTVGMTGSKRCKLTEAVQHCICVPSTDTPRIQECHILVGHIISELVEEAIFRE
jgi:D-sedoheptulose 7-phosphate isomerase